MISYITGNIFDSEAEALVNTVNTVGVMGKGIALQFKKLYPNNYKIYKSECDIGHFNIGDLLVTNDSNVLSGEKKIINFPTKKHWRSPSKYEYIEIGMSKLIELIKSENVNSIAIPPLGAGNGGLKWHKVKEILERYLNEVPTCKVYIYEPNYAVKEVLKKERVKLTPARAMLLYMLFELVENGEFVSEFASEKLCYFLQRFGGEEYLKLKFTTQYYGPYSGKVRHVLNYLNGSYIMGYADKDKKPFEELSLVVESKKQIEEYINKDPQLKSIVLKTSNFLNGHYSYYNLELLSSIDFVAEKINSLDFDKIKEELYSWNSRKKSMFKNDKFIQKSIDQLVESNLI